MREIYEENEEIEREKTELGKMLKVSQEKSIFIQYYYHNLQSPRSIILEIRQFRIS